MAETGTAEKRQAGESREGIHASSRLERGLLVAAIAVASIGLGYLFFTQLWWKLPPDFGCRNEFTRGGLCYFLGHAVEEAEASDVLLVANVLESRPGSEIAVPIGWATQLNAAFIENFVQPNIRWFGYVIWGTEAWIFLSLCLGFFSRLGALAAIGMSAQLMIGLAHTPNEWEWSYILMLLLSVAMFGLAPGRYFGLDRILRPRLKALRDRGSRAGRLLLLFT